MLTYLLTIAMIGYDLLYVCLARRVVLTPVIREILFTMVLQVGALGIKN